MVEDKDLKKLSRVELLEMLVQISEENAILLEKNKSLVEQLNNKELKIKKAGSIANAALEINGVFEAAEAAAVQYLENIKKLSEDKEAICLQMEKESREKADKMIKEAEEAVRRAESDCLRRKLEADQYWDETMEKLQQYCLQHDALKDLVQKTI